jgi:hypothetical protein
MTAPQRTSAGATYPPDRWRTEVTRLVGDPGGARFAGLFGSGQDDGGVRLSVYLFPEDAPEPLVLHTALGPDALAYPSLTPDLPAAFWYERVLHDLFGVTPVGHPRPDPLLLPLQDPEHAPLPGTARRPQPLDPQENAVPRAVTGPGVFTIPHGPVRSGVLESVEYLVETPGEDIPRVQIRVFHKHRGVSKAFEQRTVADGVLVAERVEGIVSVAHALAFSHAAETCADADVPWAARLVRVLHAELERIANHLDVMLKLTEAAGLAVATARFGLHKERVLRLTGRLCGSRFGRGVVVPGGVGPCPHSHRRTSAARWPVCTRRSPPTGAPQWPPLPSWTGCAAQDRSPSTWPAGTGHSARSARRRAATTTRAWTAPTTPTGHWAWGRRPSTRKAT